MSNVMIAINDEVRGWDTTQARAARRLGITQPRLNDLLHGKINKFSLDTLLTLATRRDSRSRSTSAQPLDATSCVGWTRSV
jgi:predicted XRE-type DNA-binding protein